MRTNIFRLQFGVVLLLLGAANISWAATPDDVIKSIGFEQRLDVSLPLDLKFVDEHARPVALREYFGQKPVILVLVYYECPMLCTQVLNSLAKTIRTMSLRPERDFEIVAVSFDPRETPALAAEKKKTYLRSFGLDGSEAGWHFLTGKEPEIKALTSRVGFSYTFDSSTRQYAHASGLIVATPQGRTSRYFYGIEYSPRDLRLGLVEASGNKIGSLTDQVLLYCYLYDPKTGSYGLVIMRVVRTLAVITFLALGAFVSVMLRRDVKAHAADRGASGSC